MKYDVEKLAKAIKTYEQAERDEEYGYDNCMDDYIFAAYDGFKEANEIFHSMNLDYNKATEIVSSSYI